MNDDLTPRQFWTLIGLCVVTLALVALVGLPADPELGGAVEETASVSRSATPADPHVDEDVAASSSTAVVPATVASPVTVASSSSTTTVVAAATSLASAECGEWRDLIAQYFPAEVDTACRVFIGCESHGDPNAVSATGDHGLAQINAQTWNRPGHHDPVADWIGRNWDHVYDPAINLAMAQRIRDAYGWSQWSCAR